MNGILQNLEKLINDYLFIFGTVSDGMDSNNKRNLCIGEIGFERFNKRKCIA